MKIKIHVPDNLHVMNNEQIGNVFFEILSNIDSGKNIVIILDSIDQLKKEDFSLEWMIYNLPERVKMIYSVLSDEKNSKKSILKKLKKRVNQKFHLFDLTKMKLLDQINLQQNVKKILITEKYICMNYSSRLLCFKINI